MMSLSSSCISGPAVTLCEFKTNASTAKWNTKRRANDEVIIFKEFMIRRQLNMVLLLADYSMNKVINKHLNVSWKVGIFSQ
jgi:hypothetical protein